jgi:hypothetical protein
LAACLALAVGLVYLANNLGAPHKVSRPVLRPSPEAAELAAIWPNQGVMLRLATSASLPRRDTVKALLEHQRRTQEMLSATGRWGG